MDPALELILREEALPQPVAVLARLHQAGQYPPGLQVISQFGKIVTGRVTSPLLRSVRAAEQVASLKAARPLVATHMHAAGDSGRDAWSPRAIHEAAGSGCLIAVLDFGCDITNPTFRKPDGSTRLSAIWDQRANQSTNARHGYGTVFRREQIDAALASASPHQSLGYPKPSSNVHGTAVMEVGATMAPASDLVFVHLDANDTHGTAHLGDSVRVAEALDFVRELAGDRPWVANLSIGSNGGPRDGTTLLEQAIDSIHAQSPLACVVCSAGNYGNDSMHAFGNVNKQASTIAFDLDPSAHAPEIEVWYSQFDQLRVRLEHVATGLQATSKLGGHAPLEELGVLYHRRKDPNNGDNHVDVFLTPNAPPGRWQLTLEPLEVTDGRYHAWIERCPNRCARFVAANRHEATTLGTLGACQSAIIVGAINHENHDSARAVYASTGPSRDGRAKPDLLARGNDIALPHTQHDGLVSGASFAAPQVSAAMAALMSLGLTREHALQTLKTTGAPVAGSAAMRIRSEVAITIAARREESMNEESAQTNLRTWSLLQHEGQCNEFLLLARAGESVAQPMPPNTWVLERGPGPCNLVTVYPASEALDDRRVALFDQHGALQRGRMLVKPRLPARVKA